MEQHLTAQSLEAQERAKWEQFERDVPRGLRPGNPYVYRPYPRMLYKAQQLPNGKWSTAMEPPVYHGYRDPGEWDRAVQAAAAFTVGCQRTVETEAEHKRARDEGWRDDPDEAKKFREGLEEAVSRAAFERNETDKRMSEKALAERDKAEADHFGHLGAIPEQPIVKRVKKEWTPEQRAKFEATQAAKKAAKAN